MLNWPDFTFPPINLLSFIKMLEEEIKVYVTKYALTKGIQVSKGNIFNDCKSIRCSSYCSFHGNEWHTDFESALKQCEKMRHRKIKSLKEQIKKLESMEFYVQE